MHAWIAEPDTSTTKRKQQKQHHFGKTRRSCIYTHFYLQIVLSLVIEQIYLYMQCFFYLRHVLLLLNNPLFLALISFQSFFYRLYQLGNFIIFLIIRHGNVLLILNYQTEKEKKIYVTQIYFLFLETNMCIVYTLTLRSKYTFIKNTICVYIEL